MYVPLIHLKSYATCILIIKMYTSSSKVSNVYLLSKTKFTIFTGAIEFTI